MPTKRTRVLPGKYRFPPKDQNIRFALIKQYSQLKGVILPAYPLVGIIICTAKFVAKNYATQGKFILSWDDGKKIRRATEEIFRGYFLGKWKGSGDSRLKEWLDRHFREVDSFSSWPKTIIEPFQSTYNSKEWQQVLRQLRETGERVVDRVSACLLFWIQYLFKRLPSGEIDFDHIVPFDSAFRETSHPFNIAIVPRQINREKAERTFAEWSDRASEERAVEEYKHYVMNDLGKNFLKHATTTGIHELLEKRRKLFERCFKERLPQWLDNGDA
ncbi:MAG: hypothetical protein QW603_02890 [Candidatus Hadarchaeales archaeon]